MKKRATQAIYIGEGKKRERLAANITLVYEQILVSKEIAEEALLVCAGYIADKLAQELNANEN